MNKPHLDPSIFNDELHDFCENQLQPFIEQASETYEAGQLLVGLLQTAFALSMVLTDQDEVRAAGFYDEMAALAKDGYLSRDRIEP